MVGISAAISHHKVTLGIETIGDVRVPAIMKLHSNFEILILLKVINKTFITFKPLLFFSVIHK